MKRRLSPLLAVTYLIICTTLTLAKGAAGADDSLEEIELNIERISELGNTQVLLSTISRLALALNDCGVDVRGLKELQRVMLTSDDAKCMDGSQAGYYIRRKSGSRRWLIFLEGGYYCFDKKSCRARADNMKNLTSSLYWPLTKDGTGILSWNPEENPFLFSANIVHIPYCSSDAWTGSNTKSGMYFMGVKIIDAVIQDLFKYGLRDADKLFLAGSSAGGAGVMMNIDRVADTLAAEAPGVSVLGISDSGWFLDTEQFHKTECTDTLNCSPTEAIRKGFRLWKPDIPRKCRRAYPTEPWRCFFGYRIYPYIKSPLFVITYLYDRAQLLASMGGGLSTYHQVQKDNYAKRNTENINYMRELARFMNHTLANVSAVFAPSCMDHEILLRSMWHSISIDGVSLVEALQCWEGSQQTTNRPGQLDIPTRISWTPAQLQSSELLQFAGENDPDDSDDSSVELGGDNIRHPSNKDLSKAERRRLRKLRKRRRRKKQRMLQARRRRIVRDVSSQNDFLANALQSNSLKAYAEERQSQCKMRLYDECSTPNCNLRCPTYMSLFSSDSNTNNRASNSFNSNARIQYNTDFSDIENSIDNPVELAEVISRQR